MALSASSSKPKKPPNASTVVMPYRTVSPPLPAPPPTEPVRLIATSKLESDTAISLPILPETGPKMQLNKFLDSPLGRSFATIFFIWFALSGWLFRFLIIATWVLPFAGPLLLGTLANSLVIKGTCPACKTQFAGYKNQMIRCTRCGNTVWQPKGKGDSFSRGGRGTSASKSDPNIIDVDFEEK